LKVKAAKSVDMLVDSGADFSLIPEDLGIILGYELAVAETLSQAEGEIVFDLFDVEFKQADEKIIFKKRSV